MHHFTHHLRHPAIALLLVACGSDATSSTADSMDDGDDAGKMSDDSSTEDDSTDADSDDDAADDDAADDDAAGDDAADDDAADDDARSDGSADDDATGEGDDTDSTGDDDAGDDSAGDPVGELPGNGFVTVETNDDGEVQILCDGSVCQCADGIDNDGDGVVDGNDGECTSAYDDNEETFSTGIPGDNKDGKWQDCFFDGNSGAGDDGCRYHTGCLTGDKAPDDPDCTVTQECIDFCAPLTIPGCDCFGCCEIEHDGERFGIQAVGTCSLANIDDEDLCPRCTPTKDCSNECGECELCVGRGMDDLPDSCSKEPPDDDTGDDDGDDDMPTDDSDDDSAPPDGTGGGGAMEDDDGADDDSSDDPPTNTCDNDLPSCLATSDCSGTAYCSFGCCRPSPVLK